MQIQLGVVIRNLAVAYLILFVPLCNRPHKSEASLCQLTSDQITGTSHTTYGPETRCRHLGSSATRVCSLDNERKNAKY
jgi:hypothetical protein